MDLKLLRDATRPEHEATEGTVPLMHAELTRQEYVAVLQRFYDVILAWETVAASEAPPEYRDLVRQRGRGESLRTDLEFFGAAFPGEAPRSLKQQMFELIGKKDRGAEEWSSRFLGLMYVVEGSTLGGQYIASHVESALHLQPGQGDQFFRGYGTATVPKWREFQQVLIGIPESQSDQTIAAAKGMFRVFAQRMSPDFNSELETFAEGKKELPAGL